MIIFKNVVKRFGRAEILHDISFEIKGGEFVFLIGNSGAGKTTVIRLIIKDLLPNEGLIKVGDFEVNKMKSKNIHLLRREVGVIFQDLRLLNDKTLWENVFLSFEVRGVKEEVSKRKVREILEFVGLSKKKDYFPQELSGGELQRAAIARAIVGDPKIILADEPTADLDPTTSWQIIQLFEKINKQGKTILFATHNVDIVNSLKKRVIGLKNGKIVKDQSEGKY